MNRNQARKSNGSFDTGMEENQLSVSNERLFAGDFSDRL